MACLALGLAVFELLPGCASSGERGAPGAELNPVVSGSADFTGFTSGPKVVFGVRVRQEEPTIIRPHTWTVRAWMSESNSADVTPDRVAWITADPCQACAPDLRAGCENVHLRVWDCRKGAPAKYTVLVVEVIEMTGGERSEVYATKTHALAFENGRQVEQRVDMPLVTDANTHAEAAALQVILDNAETESTKY
jgi:hypothetical protein